MSKTKSKNRRSKPVAQSPKLIAHRSKPIAHRPYIFANMAMTLDGKVAQVSRLPATFGSREDRRRLLDLRARADAILVGARTAKTDHYAMGLPSAALRRARVRRGQSEYPLRCVVTGRGSIEEDIEIFRHSFSPILIFTTNRMPELKRKRLEKKAQVIYVGRKQINPDHLVGVNWRKLLGILGGKFGVKKLLVEGGPTLNYFLLKENLLDEIHVTLCPKIFGGRNAPTLVEGEGFLLSSAHPARLLRIEQVDNEIFLLYRILHAPPASFTPRLSPGKS